MFSSEKIVRQPRVRRKASPSRHSTGGNATELKVRMLAGAVGRDDDGRINVRYAGWVMRSSSYTLQPVTVPVSGAGTAAARGGSRDDASRACALARPDSDRAHPASLAAIA
jgi:hypothetical protein